MAKVLPHVMRNINEFNIPTGNEYGYEILYFGVNLILMYEYRLSFNIEVKRSNSGSGDNRIEVLILSRKDVSTWKNNGISNEDTRLHYSINGESINDTFRPSTSDAYAFILSNRGSNNLMTKTVDVTLIHSWQQEVKESQFKNMP
jgi:hypothetical protein